MKKKIVYLLVFVLLIGVLSGCSKSNNNNNDISNEKENNKINENVDANDNDNDNEKDLNENANKKNNEDIEGNDTIEEEVSKERKPATFSVFSSNAPPTVPIEETVVGAKILDQLKVELDMQYLVGDAETVTGVMIASGDYPDIILSEKIKFVDAEAVIPLENMVDSLGYNLKKIYGKDELEMHKNSDGNIFAITSDRGFLPTGASGGFHLQKAVLEEFGFPEISTLDEYFDIIEKYVEKYPEINEKKTVGFLFPTEGWRFGMTVSETAKWLAGYQNDSNVFIEEKDGKFITSIIAGSDLQKRYVKKLNEVQNKGLLDNEAFTMKHDQYIAKLSTGTVVGWFDFQWDFFQIFGPLSQQDMHERKPFALPITFDEGIKEKYGVIPAPNTSRGFMISTDCKDPERAFRFMDDLLDENIQKLLGWGIEGEDHSVDENGKLYMTEEQMIAYKDTTKRAERGLDCLGYPWPRMSNRETFSDGNVINPSYDEVMINQWNDDHDRAILDGYGVSKAVDLWNLEPIAPYGFSWTIQIPQENEAKIVETQLTDLQYEYLTKAILAEPDEFDSVWNDYLNALENVNTKVLADYIQEVVNMRAEANNPNLQKD